MGENTSPLVPTLKNVTAIGIDNDVIWEAKQLTDKLSGETFWLSTARDTTFITHPDLENVIKFHLMRRETECILLQIDSFAATPIYLKTIEADHITKLVMERLYEALNGQK